MTVESTHVDSDSDLGEEAMENLRQFFAILQEWDVADQLRAESSSRSRAVMVSGEVADPGMET